MIDQLMYPLKGIGNPFNIIRHPFESMKIGIKFYWNLMKQMKWVIFRPRGMNLNVNKWLLTLQNSRNIRSFTVKRIDVCVPNRIN